MLSNMALEIITGGNCNANVTISMVEMISICHCIHSIHIMSHNIELFLENIALENITGGVSTANVMISSGNFWQMFLPKCLCTRSFDAIEVCFYQILANMMLEIITGGNSNTNDTISRGELKPQVLCLCTHPFDAIEVCHYIHPIYIMSYGIDLILENTYVTILASFDPNVYVHVSLTLYKCIWFNSVKYGAGNYSEMLTHGRNDKRHAYTPFTLCPIILDFFLENKRWKINGRCFYS